MASSNSFDIFSNVEYPEVVNAINQTDKEWRQRFDLKNSETEINLNEKEHKIVLTSKDEYLLKSVCEILKTKFVKRGVSIKALSFGDIKEAPGGRASREILIQQGISKEKAKDIVKDIKNLKIKVQAQIMEDQVRVSGKKRDDLQEVIVLVKEKDYGINIQVGNYR